MTVAAPFAVTVPDLRGVADTDVRVRLAAAAAEVLATHGMPDEPPGLVVGARRFVAVSRPDDPLGVVTAQRPAAGTTVGVYSTVDVDIASAIQRPVPRLIGLADAAARATLAEAGFGTGVVSSREGASTPGTVVAQDPGPGSTWPSGGRVALTLATPRTTVTPNVVGLLQPAALEAITGKGLTPGTLVPAASAERPGVVTGQTPAAGVRG